jgi:pilus assembly protein TadC
MDNKIKKIIKIPVKNSVKKKKFNLPKFNFLKIKDIFSNLKYKFTKKEFVKEVNNDKEKDKKIIRKGPKKIKKIKLNQYEQFKSFSNYIKKAGNELSFVEINKRILIANFSIVGILTFILAIKFFISNALFFDAITGYIILWTIGSIGIYLSLWILFFIYIDLKILQRRQEIENVFPDFLQLTAANINSGMPIDRALWFAIRPKFGILAKEMEQVAKSTIVGEKLDKALIDFSEKYDSSIIKRAFSLLLEGIKSGGEIGNLLRRVADNMRETAILKKDMASSVTTYVIFILFATLGAAPFLFGLTTQLIVIMTSIFSTIDLGDSTSGGIGGLMSGGTESIISLQDYQIFAIVSICMSSIFAAIIISVIQKGNAKEAIRKIPLYVLVGVTNYLISYNILRLFLQGIF